MRLSLAIFAVSGLAASFFAIAQPTTLPVQEVPSKAAAPVGEPIKPARRPQVQLAILLDTSNSMDGLIAQAKSQIWGIVNTLATAKQKGERPELRVALYEYGNDKLSGENGFVRRVLALTTDLDEVSAQLFALTTKGGEEYCGRVIQAATSELEWSGEKDDLKVILIAGNEPFTQGNVPYQTTVRGAVKRGIIVNTIFCGGEQDGISTMWKDGATLGEGSYAFIDTNAAAVHYASPFDDKITTLSAQLNTTYVAYGTAGRDNLRKQVDQDANAAAAAPAAAVARAATKASGAYRNDSWDLVDGIKEGKVKLEAVKEEDLPEAMRKMTPEARKAHIEKLTKERETMQREMGELQSKREAFVKAERDKAAQAPGNTLEDAVTTAIREQAKRKGFTFEK